MYGGFLQGLLAAEQTNAARRREQQQTGLLARDIRLQDEDRAVAAQERRRRSALQDAALRNDAEDRSRRQRLDAEASEDRRQKLEDDKQDRADAAMLRPLQRQRAFLEGIRMRLPFQELRQLAPPAYREKMADLAVTAEGIAALDGQGRPLFQFTAAEAAGVMGFDPQKQAAAERQRRAQSGLGGFVQAALAGDLEEAKARLPEAARKRAAQVRVEEDGAVSALDAAGKELLAVPAAQARGALAAAQGREMELPHEKAKGIDPTKALEMLAERDDNGLLYTGPLRELLLRALPPQYLEALQAGERESLDGYMTMADKDLEKELEETAPNYMAAYRKATDGWLWSRRAPTPAELKELDRQWRKARLPEELLPASPHRRGAAAAPASGAPGPAGPAGPSALASAAAGVPAAPGGGERPAVADAEAEVRRLLGQR